MILKRIIIIVAFLVLGLIFSIFTEKYWTYIPSALVIGTIIAISWVQNTK